MEITPLTDSRALAQLEPVEGVRRPGAESQSRDAATREARSSIGQQAERPGAAVTQSDELTEIAAQVGLELRVHKLPDSDVTVIRMVEPVTGEVVREFPPEGVAEMLAELRARAAAHLDRKA
jgi:uncharacterized FlaG/YvyC family protein